MRCFRLYAFGRHAPKRRQARWTEMDTESLASGIRSAAGKTLLTTMNRRNFFAALVAAPTAISVDKLTNQTGVFRITRGKT